MRETARRSGISAVDVKQHLENCEQSQFTINLCAQYRFVSADLELNAEYKQLTARREERSTEALRQAQRAWVQLRDLNCAYESSDLEGGSLRPAVELSCRQRMTEDRIEWVREMLSCTSVFGECRSSLRGRK